MIGTDGDIQTLPVNADDVEVLEICLDGSGAIGDIVLCVEEGTSTTTTTTSTTTSSISSTSTSTSSSTRTEDASGRNILGTDSSSTSTTTSTSTAVCPAGHISASIDFENLQAGFQPKQLCFTEAISAADAQLNSTVCVDLETSGRNNGAMIFDATCGGPSNATEPSGCSGPNEDSDLFHPLEGNVLILQRNNQGHPLSIPNDDANGGCFKFSFDTPSFKALFSSVVVASSVLLDIEESPVNFSAQVAAGGVLEVQSQVTADAGIQTVLLDFEDVLVLEVCLPGSGAVSDIELCLQKSQWSGSRLLMEQRGGVQASDSAEEVCPFVNYPSCTSSGERHRCGRHNITYEECVNDLGCCSSGSEDMEGMAVQCFCPGEFHVASATNALVEAPAATTITTTVLHTCTETLSAVATLHLSVAQAEALYCDIAVGSRSPCGGLDVSQADCQSRGCCWQDDAAENSSVPKCYCPSLTTASSFALGHV
eukprot:CAMPEP_0178455208 /NCGR_PEP_ID=MMETSP0689_2-20121128/45782_1 /TAXON_ID=160604 /ORGANISM="Amphidinium massartii, Strain CS-259" /LENGTH=480 /DNA_ID=CAMNT_0020081219 /DNA_START=16 /DNA_END=1458 /DNA_ORIENTATION=-